MADKSEQHHAPGNVESVPFGANAIRLTPWQWIAVGALFTLLLLALPALWARITPIADTPDYRIPFALNEDYWLYERLTRAAMKDGRTIPVVGDSVIWGQYTTPDGTLSHALNAQLGRAAFANLGLNGSHPVALAGLLQHHAGALRGRKVVLHFNPLWMSSRRRDLQTDRPARFNHPDLVPQFFPRIPSYDEPLAHRLSVAIGQRVEFLGWLKHLRMVCFENQALPAWTLAHPYGNPLARLAAPLPQPEMEAPSEAIPWTEKDIAPQSFEWVPLEESLQWRFFQYALDRLRARGNDVFVLVGPLNEHMLAEASRETYQAIRGEITASLEGQGVKFLAPGPLPSERYADSSHPLAAGYDAWARWLLEDASFQAFCAAGPGH